jgi:protein SCO1
MLNSAFRLRARSAWAGTLGLAVALAAMPVASNLWAQKVGSPGGAFELTDQNAKPFSSTQLAGKPYAIFFGFTNCPDVCPTTLLMMSNDLAKLGQDADKLRVVFVTVDPERDTPEQLRAYLSSFDPRIIGLTGSEAQIAAVAKGWNAFYNRIPESDGTYTIAHSAYVYLMDQDNRLAGKIGFQDAEPEQLAQLRHLLAGSAPN